MPYRITGTLKLPSGVVAAGVDIKFRALKSFSPLIEQAEITVRTDAAGKYDVSLEFNTYVCEVTFSTNRPFNAGQFTVAVDTVVGQDLPTLLQQAGWTPATPEWIVQIQTWLAEANSLAAAADASAKAAKVSETNSKASETSASSSASSALTSKNNSKTSETNAATSASQASASASQASTSANRASTSETNAATSASAAAQSQTLAKASETAALEAADKAEQAAQTVVGALVDGGSYEPSSGQLPTPVTSGSKKLSTIWKVTGTGVVGGIDLGNGDSLVYTSRDNSYYKIDNTESVSKVNNKTGVVVLNSSDVGAAPSGFGFGEKAPVLPPNTDLNSDSVTEVCANYSLSGAYDNGPSGFSGFTGTLQVIRRFYNAGMACMMLLNHGGKLYVRYGDKSSGTWDWGNGWGVLYSSLTKPTAAEVGADPSGTASTAITTHEAKANAHPISGISGLAVLIDTITPPLGASEWDRLRTNIRAGHVPSDGQILKRIDYPDMWAAISAGKVPVVPDADWVSDPYKRASFTLGDGSTTFRVPDENGKYNGSLGALFQRGDGLNSAGTNGIIQGDAIRNITGTLGTIGGGLNRSYPMGVETAYGVFKKTGSNGYDNAPVASQQTSQAALSQNVLLDASLMVPTGADNHPLSATGCFVVKVIKSSKLAGL